MAQNVLKSILIPSQGIEKWRALRSSALAAVKTTMVHDAAGCISKGEKNEYISAEILEFVSYTRLLTSSDHIGSSKKKAVIVT